MTIRWLTVFLDFPRRDFDAGVAFWRVVTGSALSPPRGPDSEFATLLPRHGDAYLRVQRVSEGGGGCHLDLHVDAAAASLGQQASRAEALGAQVLHREDDLIVARSPGGFAFCLVPWQGESAVPEPVHPASGGASRADQLCLDIPAGAYQRECSFWTALTGWPLHTGSLPEFARLAPSAGTSARLLLQRRGEAGPADQVTGHIDFACEDRAGLAAAHAALGGTILSAFPGWIVMADPVGRVYCLTGRDPAAGTLS